MKTIVAGIIAGFTVLFCSCTSLKSPHYIGKTVEFSEKEIGSESVWKFEEDVYHVRIVSSNKVVAATVNWDEEKKKFDVESHDLVISVLDDSLFINLKDEGLYGVFRITPTAESVVFYMADEDRLKEFVSSGKIEFREGDGDYVLNGSKEEIDEFVRQNIRILFNPNHVVVAELIEGTIE